MPDNSIALQIQNPQMQSPFQLQQGALTIQDLMQRTQMNAQTLRQNQLSMRDQQELSRAWSNAQNIDPKTGLLDPEKVKPTDFSNPAIYQKIVENHTSANYKQSQAELEKQKAIQDTAKEQQGQKMEVLKEAHDTYAEALKNGIKPDQAENLFQQKLREGLEDKQKSGLLPNDLTLPKTNGELAGRNLFTAQQQQEMDEKKKTAERNDVKEARLEKHEAAYENNMIATQNRLAQAMEERKAGNENAKMGKEDFEFGAKQYLAGDKSVMTSLGFGKTGSENRAEMRRYIRTEATKQGLSAEDVATKMAEFGGLQAGERKLGERSANIGMAVTAASKFADLALEASGKVPRSDSIPFNRILLAGEKGTGDENVVKFGAANNSFINAYARAVSPTGTPTVSDKDHAREILETAYSQGQYRSAIEQLQKEMKAEQASPAAVKQDLRDLASSDKNKLGPTKDEHTQAIEWAKAHPDDPRAKKIMEHNGG